MSRRLTWKCVDPHELCSSRGWIRICCSRIVRVVRKLIRVLVRVLMLIIRINSIEQMALPLIMAFIAYQKDRMNMDVQFLSGKAERRYFWG